MVPVLVWALQRSAADEAGMVSIGLATDAEEGSLSDQLIQRFLSEESILRYVRYNSEEEAVKALSENQVDAVWIFPEKLEEDLTRLAKKKSIRPVVRVVEREEDVALVFTREVLCSRIYPELMYDSYVSYVRENISEDLSEEELRSVYDAILWKGSLFQEKLPENVTGTAKDSYFLAPLRGLLVLWLVLAGFAALLYHKMDERHGLYDATPWKKRLAKSFGLQGVVLFNGGIIYLIACKILGVFLNPVWELLCLVLLLVCIAVFCNALGLIFQRMETIGVLIPFMILIMAVASPIFIDLRNLGAVRAFLPSYFYLRAIYQREYILHLAVYAICGVFVCILLNLLPRKRA